MKRNEIKVASSLLLVLLFFITGCTKSFLDINKNPNAVTGDNITPELIFPQAAHTVGLRQISGDVVFIQHWLGYFSNPGDYAAQKDEITYNINTSFGDTYFQNRYDVLFDLYQVKIKALAEGDSVLAGASMILSSQVWQNLVDVFGDIPYSQAFNNDKYLQPKYDKGSDIYTALQKVLDTAIAYMGHAAKSTFTTVDIVNKGNTTRWIKYANTLKLRLLIRQSEVSGFSPNTEIAKIVSNGGVLHSGETISVNPGYSNQSYKQSPFYGLYGLTPTLTDASATFRANSYIVNILKNNNDPRISYFFMNPSGGGSITGAVYGASSNPIGTALSKPGPGLANSATQNQWILTSFESMFLEAEAIARGWMSGSAQTAYNNAITESFKWLGDPNYATDAQTYYTTLPSAMWSNAGTTSLSMAKFIAFQKYIANTGSDPIESWCDQRRLNMLSDNSYISTDATKISSTIPVRLLYPLSEYTANAANVNAEGTINQFSSKIFWQP